MTSYIIVFVFGFFIGYGVKTWVSIKLKDYDNENK